MNTESTIIMRIRAIVIAVIITTCFMLFSMIGMAASPGTTLKAHRENLKMEISRNISCPDFITTNSDVNDVKAVVNVDGNGNIHIEAMSSPNAELKNYVTNQLAQMRLTNNIPTGPFVLVIKFRVL